MQQVKQLQRDSDRAKSSWHDYCDALGGGVRDPKRQPAHFLRDFFDAYNANNIPTPPTPLYEQPIPFPGSGDPKEVRELLVAKVKHGQRSSADWKEAWWSFCDSHNNGVRDPSRHDETMLRRFLTEFAPNGGAAPQERDRDRGHRAQQHQQSSSSSEVDPLAERVKMLQRGSDAIKSQWAWYCDSFGGGIRDPGRHQPAFLQQFIGMAEAGAGGPPPPGWPGHPPSHAMLPGAMPLGAMPAGMPAGGYRYHPYEQGMPAGVVPPHGMRPPQGMPGMPGMPGMCPPQQMMLPPQMMPPQGMPPQMPQPMGMTPHMPPGAYGYPAGYPPPAGAPGAYGALPGSSSSGPAGAYPHFGYAQGPPGPMAFPYGTAPCFPPMQQPVPSAMHPPQMNPYGTSAQQQLLQQPPQLALSHQAPQHQAHVQQIPQQLALPTPEPGGPLPPRYA